MEIKIITKAGRIYELKSDNLIARTDDLFFRVISYREYDSYYAGDARYRGQDTLLCVATSTIESIDYRSSENKE